MVDKIPCGLNYDTFLQAITRMAIKCKRILNYFNKEGKPMDKEDMQIMAKDLKNLDKDMS